VLTVDKCRTLLGDADSLSDHGIEQLRDALYGLADVAIASFCGQQDPAPINQHTLNRLHINPQDHPAISSRPKMTRRTRKSQAHTRKALGGRAMASPNPGTNKAP